MTTAREWNRIIMSEVMRVAREGEQLRAKTVRDRLADSSYGDQKDRINRAFQALRELRFLVSADKMGYYLFDERGLTEEEIERRVWEARKEMDSKKTRDYTQSKRKGDRKMQPRVASPVAIPNTGDDKQKLIATLIQIKKQEREIRPRIPVDAILEELTRLHEELERVREERDDMRGRLIESGRDYADLTKKYDDLLQEHTTLHQKISKLENQGESHDASGDSE